MKLTYVKTTETGYEATALDADGTLTQFIVNAENQGILTLEQVAEALEDDPSLGVYVEPVINLEAYRATALAKFGKDFVSAYRSNHYFDFMGAEIQMDEEAQANLSGFILAIDKGAEGPFAWRTAANDVLSLTADQMAQLLWAMLQAVQGAYDIAWTTKDKIKAATSVAEIDTIVSEALA